jgi:hypothetical protein
MRELRHSLQEIAYASGSLGEGGWLWGLLRDSIDGVIKSLLLLDMGALDARRKLVLAFRDRARAFARDVLKTPVNAWRHELLTKIIPTIPELDARDSLRRLLANADPDADGIEEALATACEGMGPASADRALAHAI